MRWNGWIKSQISDIKLFKNVVSSLVVQSSLTEVVQGRLKPHVNHRRLLSDFSPSNHTRMRTGIELVNLLRKHPVANPKSFMNASTRNVTGCTHLRTMLKTTANNGK